MGHPHTIGARVNEDQMARIDAAVCLNQTTRANFIAVAALREADQVLRSAVNEPPAEAETLAREPEGQVHRSDEEAHEHGQARP